MSCVPFYIEQPHARVSKHTKALRRSVSEAILVPRDTVSVSVDDSNAARHCRRSSTTVLFPSKESVSLRGPLRARDKLEDVLGKSTKVPGLTPPVAIVGPRLSAAEHAKQMNLWKHRHGHPATARVFKISAGFRTVRKALLERGWVENEDAESTHWDFMYTLSKREIGYFPGLADCQVVNHFSDTSALTRKAGLCESLGACCPLDGVDVDSFYPRCYHLSNELDVANVVKDFKSTACLSLLKRFVTAGGLLQQDGDAASSVVRSAVAAALIVCKRRCNDIDVTLDEESQPSTSSAEWRAVQQYLCPSAVYKSNAGEWSGAPASLNKDSDLLPMAREVLKKLEAQLSQFDLDGCENIWVLKPAGSSRGRGIRLSTDLDDILSVANKDEKESWVVQKYIENPQIIRGKKFDIRQWVVVTCWDPLCVWFYQDSYLRFAFDGYSTGDINNKFAHLTNNSISKHNPDFEEQRDSSMWHSREYRDYLRGLHLEKDGHKIVDPWYEKILPAMKRIVYRSLEAVQERMKHRTNSFELFGYDFMVADNLKVWLIEVNSSPDCSSSTLTTKNLVKEMLESVVAVVVDAEQFGIRPDRPRRKWGTTSINTEAFELLEPERREEEEQYKQSNIGARPEAMQFLSVRGSRIRPPLGKKV